MTTTILCDFFGTLIDSYSVLDNISLDTNDKIAPVGYQSLPEILAKTGAKSKAQVLKQLQQLFKDSPLRFSLFAPLVDNLAILKKAGFRLGVLAPKCGAGAQKICEQNALFDFVDEEATLFGNKPALQKSLKKHDLSVNQLFYLTGDAKHIAIANQLRIPTIAVSWGFDTPQDCQNALPTYTIAKPGELLTVVTEALR